MMMASIVDSGSFGTVFVAPESHRLHSYLVLCFSELLIPLHVIIDCLFTSHEPYLQPTLETASAQQQK